MPESHPDKKIVTPKELWKIALNLDFTLPLWAKCSTTRALYSSSLRPLAEGDPIALEQLGRDSCGLASFDKLDDF